MAAGELRCLPFDMVSENFAPHVDSLRFVSIDRLFIHYYIIRMKRMMKSQCCNTLVTCG